MDAEGSGQDEAQPAVVAPVLARATGDAAITVERVTALTGGAASMTYAVDAIRDGRSWPLILQRRAAAKAPEGALPKAVQAELQKRARAYGLPVAAVVAPLLPSDGLGDGFIMERVDGESLAPRYLRGVEYAGARAALTRQCATMLARLHAIPMDELADLPLPRGTPAEQRERLFDLYRSFGMDSPVFDLAFAWLHERLPAAFYRQSLIHGDFRSGNFIVGPEGLRAVLDWELAHLGDPLEDLGWLCVNAWRFGEWRKPVGGFGKRDELYGAYAAAGGQTVDREQAHVWEVYGTLRWGIACLQLAHEHQSGRVVSVERAAIGRRISETEIDLLHLIKVGDL